MISLICNRKIMQAAWLIAYKRGLMEFYLFKHE